MANLKNRNDFMVITSVQNDNVKYWRKLHKRKERSKTNTFLVEGFHLVEEAVKSDWPIIELLVDENITVPDWCAGLEITTLSKSVFAHISQTEAPQGIAAILQQKKQQSVEGNHLLLVDAIQDPGNLGTLIRTADAAGLDMVVLGKGTVDLYNDKVIRATQGSLFHLPVITGDLVTIAQDLQQQGVAIWASALKNASSYHTVHPKERTALIVGNEGSGIQEDLFKLATTRVTIPIYGDAESLNVGIAAGILMYHIKTIANE